MGKSRPLVYFIEDDESIRKLVSYSLGEYFECRDFSLPHKFWKKIEKKTPDLVLLDVMLPEENGLEILGKLKNERNTRDIPVILLTARDSDGDIVQGLDSGADDYITKPFGMSILVSRINAVLRRCAEKSSDTGNVLEAGKITVDMDAHTVKSNGTEVSLTVKEFSLLAVLLKNRGKVLSREELLDSIWNIDAEIESRTVDVHVKTLRQKLKDENLIETVRGIGYRYRI